MPSRKRHRQNRDTTAEVTDAQGPWAVDSPLVAQRLIAEIFNNERVRPLIIVSHANDTDLPRVDVAELQDEIGEHAHIAVLHSGPTTWALTQNVPDHFRAYGGGTRVCWPFATPEDEPYRHPLFVTRTEDDSDKTITRIVRLLRNQGYIPEEEPPNAVAPWSNDASTDSPEDDKVSRLLADLATANERIATLTSENITLNKTVHGLTDQVAMLKQRLHATDLYTDRAEQLRHEIEHAWLLTYSEPEREQHPLATYTFGPDFVASVDGLEGVDRDKIVATCLDVVTRRAWEVNGRQARQMRATQAAGSPYRTRDDGAAAWRCNIQTGTASARRLMWWEVPDGTIELALAALHDDIDFR